MKNIYEFLKSLKDEKNLKKCQLLIVNDDKQAIEASHIVSFLGFKPFVLSDFRANFKDDLHSFSDELQDITKALQDFYRYKKEDKILISPLRTISFPMPKKECFDEFIINFGDKLDLNSFKQKLYSWGYYFVDIVTSLGEVSFRGDIFDIAPLGSDFGYRVSLFDDEVESIRKFDIEDQKSQKDELESFNITPAFLALNEDSFEEINSKIELSTSDAFVKDIHSLGFWYLDNLAHYLPQNMNSFITQEALSELDEAYIFEEKRLNKDKFLTLPQIYSSKDYKEVSPSNIKEFISFHKDKKITIITTSEARVKALELSLDDKLIKYHFSEEIINLLSSKELIISLNKEINKKRKKE